MRRSHPGSHFGFLHNCGLIEAISTKNLHFTDMEDVYNINTNNRYIVPGVAIICRCENPSISPYWPSLHQQTTKV